MTPCFIVENMIFKISTNPDIVICKNMNLSDAHATCPEYEGGWWKLHNYRWNWISKSSLHKSTSPFTREWINSCTPNKLCLGRDGVMIQRALCKHSCCKPHTHCRYVKNSAKMSTYSSPWSIKTGTLASPQIANAITYSGVNPICLYSSWAVFKLGIKAKQSATVLTTYSHYRVSSLLGRFSMGPLANIYMYNTGKIFLWQITSYNKLGVDIRFQLQYRKRL